MLNLNALMLLRASPQNVMGKCKYFEPMTFARKFGNDPSIKSFEEIPGPKNVGMLRFMLRYSPLFGGYNLQKLHENGKKEYELYGSLRKVSVPKRFEIVVPYDPDDIEKVFRNEGKCPRRLGFNSMINLRRERKDAFLGNVGLFTDDQDEWYSIRSKTQGLMMRPKVISSYIPKLSSVADDMVLTMRRARESHLQIDNFLGKLYNWALESVGVFALDQRLGCLSADADENVASQEIIQVTNDAITSLTANEFGLPLWKYFPTKGWKMMVKSQLFLCEIAHKRIVDTRERLKLKNEDDEFSFLETLIKQNRLGEGELLCFILDLFMAGVDTTSHTVAFFLYHLSKNPRIQERLRQEILENASDGEVSAGNLEKMKYLKACLKESMRMMHTVIGTSRIIDNEITLSGYKIPKGSYFALQSMVVANLDTYVKNPTTFMPERWLKDSEAEKLHRFAFFPFGYGPRMCIGKRLAELEIYLLIIKIIYNFQVTYDGHIDILTKLVNIPDKPLEFQFHDHE